MREVTMKVGHVRSRRWGLVALLIAVTPGAGQAECTYSDFINKMMANESAGVVDAVNKYGYMGLFQMGDFALHDAGLRSFDWGYVRDLKVPEAEPRWVRKR